MGNKLVAYFSASGVTAKMAKKLAEGMRFSNGVSGGELKKWADEWL